MPVATVGAVASNPYGFAQPNFAGTVGACYNTVTFEDVTAKSLFTLPAGAVVLDWNVSISIDFNAASTDTLSLGIAGDDDYFANALNVATQTVVRYGASGSIFTRIGTQLTQETTITAIYAGTGAAATTGTALVTFYYVVMPL